MSEEKESIMHAHLRQAAAFCALAQLSACDSTPKIERGATVAPKAIDAEPTAPLVEGLGGFTLAGVEITASRF